MGREVQVRSERSILHWRPYCHNRPPTPAAPVPAAPRRSEALRHSHATSSYHATSRPQRLEPRERAPRLQVERVFLHRLLIAVTCGGAAGEDEGKTEAERRADLVEPLTAALKQEYEKRARKRARDDDSEWRMLIDDDNSALVTRDRQDGEPSDDSLAKLGVLVQRIIDGCTRDKLPQTDIQVQEFVRKAARKAARDDGNP